MKLEQKYGEKGWSITLTAEEVVALVSGLSVCDGGFTVETERPEEPTGPGPSLKDRLNSEAIQEAFQDALADDHGRGFMRISTAGHIHRVNPDDVFVRATT